MRALLAVGFLISLTACASAAPLHGTHTRHLAITHHGQTFTVPRESYAAVRPQTYYDDTPSYDDLSKLGGQPPSM
jgi:hypothetical protein